VPLLLLVLIKHDHPATHTEAKDHRHLNNLEEVLTDSLRPLKTEDLDHPSCSIYSVLDMYISKKEVVASTILCGEGANQTVLCIH